MLIKPILNDILLSDSLHAVQEDLTKLFGIQLGLLIHETHLLMGNNWGLLCGLGPLSTMHLFVFERLELGKKVLDLLILRLELPQVNVIQIQL
jgi:hypothetical protein